MSVDFNALINNNHDQVDDEVMQLSEEDLEEEKKQSEEVEQVDAVELMSDDDTEPLLANEESDEAEERTYEQKVEEKIGYGAPIKKLVDKPPNITIKCRPFKFNMPKG